MVAAHRIGALSVLVHKDQDELAQAAADTFAAVVRAELRERPEVAVMLATGNSQLAFMRRLRESDVEWQRVRVFHMDEYVGIAEDHPASFRRYLHDQLVDVVRPRAFHPVVGDAPDPEAEARRYGELLADHPRAVCVMGIGENGHLAFNDPPADLHATDAARVVELDIASRRQQVGEGHFPTLEATPERAITVTIPALLAARRVLVVVPEERKAAAVRDALTGDVRANCPASVLRRHEHATLHLDRGSASLLGHDVSVLG